MAAKKETLRTVEEVLAEASRHKKGGLCTIGNTHYLTVSDPSGHGEIEHVRHFRLRRAVFVKALRELKRLGFTTHATVSTEQMKKPSFESSDPNA